ncbi:MAG: FUSC family protein [Nocardioidaceae bacterium]
MSHTSPFDRAWDRGRLSLAQRWHGLRAKAWHVGQCALAAGAAWFLATHLLGHPRPFFAPIAAVVSLGTSYGQRLRRIIEVSLGIAVGIFLADLLLLWLGSGTLQLILVIALAMSLGFLLNPSPIFVTQVAVQATVLVTLVATPRYAFTRWSDALVGGAVALVAAAVVPRAPLRRPREQAARVVRRLAELLHAAARSVLDGDVERGLTLLADARATDSLIRELQAAADEGMSVIASSPFRRRHTGAVRRVGELVEPLDRALRNTRVLVRRIAVANHHHQRLPRAYSVLCEELAVAGDLMADLLASGEMPTAARDPLLRIGVGTAQVERIPDLSADVVLAQIRSTVVDLLQVTGLGVLESTDALPPPNS